MSLQSMKQVRSSFADTARLLVLGTDSIDQLFAHVLSHYASTQQNTCSKMLGQDTAVNQVNVNSKGDNDYCLHCQSKVIGHPIFWLCFGSISRNMVIEIKPS